MPTDLHQILKLESSVANLESELKTQRQTLDNLRNNCTHEWGDTENADIVTPAYTTQGDPPGTMGIDWRGPQYVPEQRTRRWKRKCQCCGLVQYTSEAAPQITEKPVFR
jgi:hypothetical protein